MVDYKDNNNQINEYHMLLENLKTENINLPKEFVSRILIEKLSDLWSVYKQQLKHKHRQLSLADLITHIMSKEMASKANLVQGNPSHH